MSAINLGTRIRAYLAAMPPAILAQTARSSVRGRQSRSAKL